MLPNLRARAFPVLLVLALLALGFTLRHVRRDLRRLEIAVLDIDRVVTQVEETLSRPAVPETVSPLLIHYQLDLPGRGEVFPALSTLQGLHQWPVALLQITNTAGVPVAQTVVAEIPEWSRPFEKLLVLGPRETRQVRIHPELLPAAFANHESRPARLDVRAVSAEGIALFADSREILLHGGSEIFWGHRFANAQVAARWVTPHDPAVLDLVSKARRYVPRGRLAGYAGSVEAQAGAVFRALQRSGITYVNSLFVMGEFLDQAQRVRLPRETLALKSANCMDVSVTFASAMENLGLQPVILIVPSHAFTGVRLQAGAEEFLYLDLTVLPDGSLASAETRARNWLRKTPPERVLVVDVAAARAMGIYPLP